MDEIEFYKSTASTCQCCGTETTRLTRFVTRHGNAFSIYFAVYSTAHRSDGVHILAGFGDWSEEAARENRAAFSFRIWSTDDNFNTTLENPDEDRWGDTSLGRKLSRQEALAHEWLQEVYDLSDLIVRWDEPIKQFLNEQ
ncbi:MAG TPA: hypothetical protein VGH02_02780 [Rhizomicrobium sp.]|jgi:hypothetical protein